jgi:hypothetical protein
MTELLKPTEAARRLGITYGGLAVWRCKQRKALPFVRIGRKIFYRASDIEKFITDNMHPGDGSQPTQQSRKRAAR